MWNNLKNRLLALHEDEGGADMVEYILIVAAIGLPLLGAIMWFWKDVKEWMTSLWENIKSNANNS